MTRLYRETSAAKLNFFAMGYIEHFHRVRDHALEQGAKVDFEPGPVVSTRAIAKAQKKSIIPIPDSLAEFYAEVGDGVWLRWITRAGSSGPFANVEILPLADVAILKQKQIGWRVEWDNTNDFRFTDDPELGKRTAARMRSWLGFYDEGSGDRICLDTAAEPAAVVFDQHDWMDGGTGENGHVMAGSLIEFIRDWSTVCFQFPKSLWWPNVLRPGGGVRWESDEFNDRFRLT